MDWYRELVTMEYLKLEDNIMVDKFKLARLSNGVELVQPVPVKDFGSVVLVRDRSDDKDHLMLYDVSTKRTGEGRFSLFGRIMYTINPYTFEGTEEDFGQNFLIIKQSATMIHSMKQKRVDAAKKPVGNDPNSLPLQGN